MDASLEIKATTTIKNLIVAIVANATAALNTCCHKYEIIEIHNEYKRFE